MTMPNNAKVFPRGYSGGQSFSNTTFKTRTGDAEISELWQEYTQSVNNSNTWHFRKKVFPVAKRLLGGRPNWFLFQDSNPLVRDYNYQFVTDTLRFIGTGKRRISIHAWPDLVSNHPKDELDDVSERHEIADIFRSMDLSTSVEKLLQMWCSHKGGFDDMVCTLNILFGDIQVKTPSNVL